MAFTVESGRTLPHLARPLSHTVHAVTFAVLLVTGLLLFVPDLRAAATGGYSLVIGKAHCWSGVAFVVLPVLIILRYGLRSILAPPEKRTLRTAWKGLHLAITILASGLFTVSGFVLWGESLVAEATVDVSRLLHDWLTYAAAVLLVVHLLEAGVAGLVGRVSSASAAVAPRPQM
jgi:cytochrome b subunit of formate dehydrogenase